MKFYFVEMGLHGIKREHSHDNFMKRWAGFLQERYTKTSLGPSIKAVTWGCVWVICWKRNNGHKCIVCVHIPCTTTHHMRHQLQCGCAHPHSAKWCSMGRCVQCQHIHHDAHPLAPCVNRGACKLHTMQRWKVELVHLTQVVVLQPYTTHGGCSRAVNYYTVC